MLKFIDIDSQTPPKRDAATRRQDFSEIYGDFIRAKADEQSARCSQCGVPFCQSGCPLENNIPDWLYLAASGRLGDAYKISSATNLMPEICGRICPQDRLCEGACVIETSGHGAVTIGAVERYITDEAWVNGWVAPLVPAQNLPLSAGIIGAGPAGLAAAEQLRALGWRVTIYDRHDRAGGLLMYGIPNFKLDKSIVTRRIERLKAGGVAFKLGIDIGKDISFEDVRKNHAAVLIATGVYQARQLSMPGAGTDGVIDALPYLTQSNRRGLGDMVKQDTVQGKDVVVIGGGDTAMDCVRTAIRQKANSVTCLYRRDQINMPGSARETANAMEEGVMFEWLAGPQSIHNKNGKAVFVRAQRMRLGRVDRSGRESVDLVPGSEFDVKADIIIQALGFTPEDMGAFSGDLTLTRWGTVKAHPVKFSTSIPGVFAAGDIVRGASLVVWAIREGMDAAAEMNRYMSAQLSAIQEMKS